MPDIKSLRRVPPRDVGGDPLHLACALAKPRFRGFQRGGGDVQYRHTSKPARQQTIDQPRCASTDIDDGRVLRRSNEIDQFERERGLSSNQLTSFSAFVV